jgi:PAS domain S-box-containing protein
MKIMDSIELYKAFFDASPDGIILVDVHGEILLGNSLACTMFGYTKDELAGLNIEQLVPVRFREQYDGLFQDFIKQPIQRALGDGKELLGLKKDQSEFTIEIRPNPLSFRGDTYFYATLKDISEPTRAARILKENEERYRILVENAPEALVVFDTETEKFVDVSQTALELFKMSREQLLSIGVAEISPTYQPDGRLSSEAAKEKNVEAQNGGKPVFEWIHMDSEGKAIPCEVRLIRLPAENKVLIRGSISDISERKKAEEYAKERSIQLQILSDNLPNVFMYQVYCNTDRKMKFSYLSKSVSKLTGKSPEAIIQDPSLMYNIVVEDDRAALAEAEELSYRNLSPFYADMRCRNPKGEIRWVHLSSVPRKAENGIVIWDGVLVDITDRKQADEVLRNTKEKYRSLLNKLDAAIVLHAPDTSIINSNPKAVELLGLSEEQLKGKMALDPEWKFMRVDHSTMPIEEYPVNVILSTKKGIRNLTIGIYRPLTKDTIWAMVTGYPVFNGNNEIVEVVISFIDISERKRAEEEISASEEKYRSLVEHATDAIFIADGEGRFIMVNSSMCRISGYTEQELKKLTIYDFAIHEDLQKNPFHFDELRQGKTVVTERNMKGKGGIHLSVEIKAKLLSDARLLIFVRDISRQKEDEQAIIAAKERAEASERDLLSSNMEYEAINKKLIQTNKELMEASLDIRERKITEAELKRKSEELVRANQELEQFAYAASHDLQEPLRTISNFTGLLNKRSSEKTEEEEHYIQFILKATIKMQNLVKALLDFSRIGRKVSADKVDCNEVLKDVLANLKASITESDASVTASSLPQVIGNEIELKQLFQNLISNAIKFRKKNERACIEVSSEERENDYLFTFKDNGIGIDKKYQDKVFIIFQRLHTDAEYQGTGIGLATCNKIVSQHNGKIWVESQLGEGCTFYFTIAKEN